MQYLNFDELSNLEETADKSCVHVIIWEGGTSLCPPENCENPDPDATSTFGHVSVLNTTADEIRYISFQPKHNIRKIESTEGVFYTFEQDLYSYEGSSAYVISLKSRRDISPYGCLEKFKDGYDTFSFIGKNCTTAVGDYLNIFFGFNLKSSIPGDFAKKINTYLKKNPEKQCY